MSSTLKLQSAKLSESCLRVFQMCCHSIARLHLHLLKFVHSAALGVCRRKERHLGDLLALRPYLDGRRDDLWTGEARVEHKLAEGLWVAVRWDPDATESEKRSGLGIRPY